jgi:hypothetical protein
VTDIEILIITYGEQTRWAGYYSEGVEADIKNEEAISTLTKLKAEIDRLNAEWMAKCEELRKDAERYRWLRNEHFPTADNPPLAQVVWKAFGNRHNSDWANMIDGHDLDVSVDTELAKKEGA